LGKGIAMKNDVTVWAAAVLLIGLSAGIGHAASPSSAYCKSLLSSMSGKPKAKAMALSSDGQFCSAYWGEKSQATADKKAVSDCQNNGKRKCSVVKR